MSPRPAVPRPWMRALLWLWLGIWIGAMGLFGAVTRVAFDVVQSPHLAAQLVGRLLDPLLAAGTATGLGLAWLGRATGRGRMAWLLPLVIAATCLGNQLVVVRAVAAIDLGDPSLAAGQAARFATLHRLSVWLFLAAGLAAVALAVLHGRAELREPGDFAPGAPSTAGSPGSR